MSTAIAACEALERAQIPGQGYAQFMRLRGYDVLERLGVFWHSVPGRLYMSFPYYVRPELDPAEVARMIREVRATGVRYPSLTGPGVSSGLYVCDPAVYGLDSIDSKVSRSMKRGLAECEVRETTTEELLTQGFEVSRATLARQNRTDPELGEPRGWRRLVGAIEECPCAVAYGAFVNGSLSAMAIACVEDGWMSVLYRMANYAYPELRVSHVLDYRIIHDFARPLGLASCTFGLMSLTDNPGLHIYKTRMGIACESQFAVIRLHPVLAPVLTTRAAIAAADYGARLTRNSDYLVKCAAVLKGAAASRQDR